MSKKYRGIIPQIQDSKEPTVITNKGIVKAFEELMKFDQKPRSSFYITWGCITNGHITRDTSNLIYCENENCKNCRYFERLFSQPEKK